MSSAAFLQLDAFILAQYLHFREMSNIFKMLKCSDYYYVMFIS